MPKSIFVILPSYRDPDLHNTLLSLLHTSSLKIRVGLVNQDEKPLLTTINDYDCMVEEMFVPYMESAGACWARKQCQSLYRGEDYVLMIDSHMRFVDNWDKDLIAMQGETGGILTSYVPNIGYEGINPWRIVFDKYSTDGVVMTRPEHIVGGNILEAKFFSAHFAFAEGKFVKDVPYDEQMYFLGEETSIAMRAYTNGYNMYHPNKIFCYHEYTREGRTKHWDDHKNWRNLDLNSINRYKACVGAGVERTVAEYERFAGIRFNA